MRKLTKAGSEAELRGFTFPVLHAGKRWYVDFYAKDPETGLLRQKRYSIPDGISLRKKNEKASFLLASIRQRLEEGWSPWSEKSLVNGIYGYTPFGKCMQRYIDSLKTKERKSTCDNYRSRINILTRFLGTREQPLKYAWQFDKSVCSDFLEWLQAVRHVSPRTRNNYRGWLYGFAEFLVTHRYVIRNPIVTIPIIAEDEKIRKSLSHEMLKRLSSYLQEHDMFFYLACLMEYYTMIRPSELVNLKIGDISVSEQSVYVDGRFSKNHRSAKVGLNSTVILTMRQLDIFSRPSDNYLFGKGMMPGKEQCSPDLFNRTWKKVREDLGWDVCYQFYSLKDSGIRDLANSEGIVVARDQARHMDISVTNKYIQQHEVHECTKHFHGAL